jgi:hypothetical protein
MVNNSTNINKVNNHLSYKESFNSDGQQFHQYQQNVQPPFTSKQLNLKKTTTYSVTNPGPDLGQYKNVLGFLTASVV